RVHQERRIVSLVVSFRLSVVRKSSLVFGRWPKQWLPPVIRDLSYNGLASDQGPRANGQLLMIKLQVAEAIRACLEKKAEEITILELEKGAGAFTDYFVVCSGTNSRQIQAISDEVEERLERKGLRPAHMEGYRQAEWVLLDYVDFVVHIFSEKARKYYELERLWKSAKK